MGCDVTTAVPVWTTSLCWHWDELDPPTPKGQQRAWSASSKIKDSNQVIFPNFVSVWLQEISPANEMLHLIITVSTSPLAGLATMAWKTLAKPQVIPCCRWGLAVLWQPLGSLIPLNPSDLKFYLRCSLLNVLSYSKTISTMICQATTQSYCDMHL